MMSPESTESLTRRPPLPPSLPLTANHEQAARRGERKTSLHPSCEQAGQAAILDGRPGRPAGEQTCQNISLSCINISEVRLSENVIM